MNKKLIEANQRVRLDRRNVVRGAVAAGVAGLIPGLQAAVYAAGSDKPEKEEVKIGFIPLTDCASVVMNRTGFRGGLLA